LKGNSLKLEKNADFPFFRHKTAGFSFMAAKKDKPSFLDSINPFLGEKNCFARPRKEV